ncbi:DUF4229 domain-containing protein [Cellulomonas edaphi]|uniref:DUF4229 domain-containing protein n=1 Tax=Cellulomonas edaphi TaxID=3053468 RepID=A0ABT7S9D8_9CELL|nr:DUF4229 domain-containing protein [Cellulomons edaphi]MDM7832233.1 DUF4229 domain-containing protein [Cellulomons edaphi]
MPVVTYTLLRLALFAAATAGAWWAGMHSWLAPLAGLVIGWLLGYLLLDKQRTRAAAFVQARSEGRPGRARTATEKDAELEDELDEAARRGEPARGDDARRGGQPARGDDQA